MLRGNKFLFVGDFIQFKIEDLHQAVESAEGYVVELYDETINYVVIPNIENIHNKSFFGENILMNAVKDRKPIVHLDFILSCFEEKKLVPVDKFLCKNIDQNIEMENQKENQYISQYQNIFTPLFGPGKFKMWREYENNHDGTKFYYNIVTSQVQWEKPSDFDSLKIANEEEMRSQCQLVRQYQMMVKQYQQQYQMLQQQFLPQAGYQNSIQQITSMHDTQDNQNEQTTIIVSPIQIQPPQPLQSPENLQEPDVEIEREEDQYFNDQDEVLKIHQAIQEQQILQTQLHSHAEKRKISEVDNPDDGELETKKLKLF